MITENDVIAANMGLVIWVVQRLYSAWSAVGLEREDVRQSACIGMLKALRSDEGVGSKFSTYAVVVMRNEILDLVRYRRRLCRRGMCLSLDTPLSSEGDMTLMDTLSYDQDFTAMEVRDALERLPPRQRDTIMSRMR